MEIETDKSIQHSDRQLEPSGSLFYHSLSLSIGNDATDILSLSPSLSPFLSPTLPFLSGPSRPDNLSSCSVAKVAIQKNGCELPLYPHSPDSNGNGIVARDAIDTGYHEPLLNINIDMNIGSSDNGIDLEQVSEPETGRQNQIDNESGNELARQVDSSASTNSIPPISHLPSPTASASISTSPSLPDGVKSANVVSANPMRGVPNSASNKNMRPQLVAVSANHSQHQQVNEPCGSILSSHEGSEVHAYKQHKKRACIPCYNSKIRCVGNRCVHDQHSPLHACNVLYTLISFTHWYSEHTYHTTSPVATLCAVCIS